ncbi:hypothetical protein KUCAC02_020625, partial [Chaenocephalus aceratus]
ESCQKPIQWKLCVFCLLCEAYLRWSLLHGTEQSSDPADIIRYTKEWEFYGMFGLAALELSAFCVAVMLFLVVVVGRLQGATLDLRLLLRALLISCYGKVLLIPRRHLGARPRPALPGPHSRLILNSSRRLSLLAVCVGLLSETCVARASEKLLWSAQDILTFD